MAVGDRDGLDRADRRTGIRDPILPVGYGYVPDRDVPAVDLNPNTAVAIAAVYGVSHAVKHHIVHRDLNARRRAVNDIVL